MKTAINDSSLLKNNEQFKEVNFEIKNQDTKKIITDIISKTIFWVLVFDWGTTLIKAYKNNQ